MLLEMVLTASRQEEMYRQIVQEESVAWKEAVRVVVAVMVVVAAVMDLLVMEAVVLALVLVQDHVVHLVERIGTITTAEQKNIPKTVCCQCFQVLLPISVDSDACLSASFHFMRIFYDKI